MTQYQQYKVARESGVFLYLCPGGSKYGGFVVRVEAFTLENKG